MQIYAPFNGTLACMCVLVVEECKKRLLAVGFKELREKESWKVNPLGKVRVQLLNMEDASSQQVLKQRIVLFMQSRCMDIQQNNSYCLIQRQTESLKINSVRLAPLSSLSMRLSVYFALSTIICDKQVFHHSNETIYERTLQTMIRILSVRLQVYSVLLFNFNKPVITIQ